MQHYKIQLEVGKKFSQSRTMYVRSETIVEAMGIGTRIKKSKLVSISPITYEEYMKGVDKKYTSSRTL